MKPSLRLCGPVALAGTLLLAACAGPPQPTPELVDARERYRQAEANQAIDPDQSVQMYEARKELDHAGRALEEKESPGIVNHYARLAATRVRIAQLDAETRQMRARVQELEQQAGEMRLEARTREADRAAERAAVATERAAVATERAVAAKRAAREAEQKLDQLEAEQTERGLVLTLGGVLFEFGKAALKPAAEQQIARIAGFLIANPRRAVLIEGHTDDVGSEPVNQKLSLARAESVREALLANGIEPSRLQAEGFGKAFPVAANTTDAGRRANRRVEIIILEPGQSIGSARRR